MPLGSMRCKPTFQFSTMGRRAPLGCIQEVDPPLANVGSKKGPCGTGGKPIFQLKAGVTPALRLARVAWVKYPCWLRKMAGPALVSYMIPKAARRTVSFLKEYAKPIRGPKPLCQESANWAWPVRPLPLPSNTSARAATRAGVGDGGVEIGQAVEFVGDGWFIFPAQAVGEGQVGTDFPAVLGVNAPVAEQ